MRRLIQGVIFNTLQAEHDASMAELLFLEHQIKLPYNYRKTEMEDHEMGKWIAELKRRCREYEEALNEIQQLPITDNGQA